MPRKPHNHARFNGRNLSRHWLARYGTPKLREQVRAGQRNDPPVNPAQSMTHDQLRAAVLARSTP